MKYRVTLAMRDAPTATVDVIATNKGDAEYRAAVKAETLYGGCVDRVIACRKAA